MNPGSMLILFVAMIAQALPGGDGPALPVESKPGDPPKQWLVSTSPIDGQSIQILGWKANGRTCFDPRDYPQFTPAKPSTRPSTEDKTGKVGAIPTGVITEKLPHLKHGAAWYGGNATNVVGQTAETEQGDRIHLTVIGSDRERAQVMSDLQSNPELAALATSLGDRLAIQDYGPTDPMVTGIGLPNGGKPDIVIQDATGKELYRESDYRGPKHLANEIRKADPTYRPGKPSGVDETPEIVLLVVGGMAFIAILAGVRKGARP